MFYNSNEKTSSDYLKRAIEEVEEAGFAMREELREAEVAVEACYRRRARITSLAEMLPADRPLSEKELDTLRELLREGLGPELSVGGRSSR